MNERDTLKINTAGHLEIGGADCVRLAEEFRSEEHTSELQSP